MWSLYPLTIAVENKNVITELEIKYYLIRQTGDALENLFHTAIKPCFQ